MPGLHLAVLWSFAVAQPLLDVLGDAPEFFVARENTRADIVVLALGLTLVPPLIMVGIEVLASLVSLKLRRWVHLVFVAALAAAFLLQLLKDRPGGSAAVLIPVSVVAGLVLSALYLRTQLVPTLLTVLAPAPLVFVFVFLVISPVSKLVLPGKDVEASTVHIPGHTPVVMIFFDELSGSALMGPDRRINAERFPAFARLARDSTWYRNANTVADFTDRAVPALLTGERPERNAAPIAADHPESLFTLLGGKYSFDVKEPVTDVCPERLCPAEAATRQAFDSRVRELVSDLSVVSLHLLLPDDLERDLPPVDRSFGDFRRLGEASGGAGAAAGAPERGLAALIAFAQRAKQFREFNERLRHDPGGSHLSFLHVQFPHNPYYYLPTGQRYPETLTLPGLDNPGSAGTWSRNAWLAHQARQRYLLQSEYGDRLLGQAMTQLRASGQYDRSLVVVTADHGASFTPGEPHRAATLGNLPQIAGIPLLIKAPGQRQGRIDDANVHSTDLLATVASLLRIHLPWPTAGRPAGDEADDGAVTVQPQFGDEDVSMPFREFVRRRDAVVSGIAADFGRSPGDLYRIGPDKDLLGRDVDSLAARASPAGFELDASGLVAAVNPKGRVVPSFLTGQVHDVPQGARLALAVAGRVATVTIPYEDGDVRRFSAIVPPTAFMRGANDVEAIAITGHGPGRTLARLRGGPVAYRVVGKANGQALVDASGRRFPVVASAVQGSVEKLSADEADVRAEGWAGTVDPPRAADRIVVFAGDRFLAAGRPYLRRRDIAAKHGSALARSGFRLSAGARGPAGARVLVYAIAGNRASLLNPGR